MTDRERAICPTLDLKEAAAFLHLGYEAMKSLVDSGQVPAVSLNQKHTVLLREDLVAFIRDEGRRQADERKRLKRKPLATESCTPTRNRSRVLPDLSKYEIVTRDVRPSSIHVGSNNAGAS